MNQIYYKGEIFGGVGEDVTNKQYSEVTIHNPYTNEDETFNPIGGQNAEIFNSYSGNGRNIATTQYSQIKGVGNKDLSRSWSGGCNDIQGQGNIAIDSFNLSGNGDYNFIDGGKDTNFNGNGHGIKNVMFNNISGYRHDIENVMYSNINGSENIIKDSDYIDNNGDHNKINNISCGLFYGNFNKVNNYPNVDTFIDLDTELSPVTISSYYLDDYGRSYFDDSNNQTWTAGDSFDKENHTFTNGCYSISQNFIYLGNFRKYLVYKELINNSSFKPGGHNIYIFGDKNDVLFNKYNNNNFILGDRNGMSYNNAQYSIISGYDNILRALTTTVLGTNNIIEDGQTLFITGHDNHVDYGYCSQILGRANYAGKDEDYNTQNTFLYSLISGYENKNFVSISSQIFGEFNNIEQIDGGAAFGRQNSVRSLSNSGIISGINNTVDTMTRGCHVLGCDNKISSIVYGTLVCGSGNEITTNAYRSLISGSQNKISYLSDSFICGGTNTIAGADYSLILSNNNKITNADYSFVGGLNSTLGNLYDSIVFGEYISGPGQDENVKPTADISNSLVVGQYHKIIGSLDRSTVLGYKHTLQTPLHYVTVLGCENTIINNKYSFITGYHNNLIGTNGSKTFNVLGNSNSLTSGDNTVVLGSNNTITGGNDNITMVGNTNEAQGGNSNAYVFGTGLFVPGGCANITILGNYNLKNNISYGTNTSFLIANGTDDNNRSDAYEVRKDGTQIFYFKDKNVSNTLGIGKITLQQDLITIESLKTNSNNEKETVTFTFEELKQLKNNSQLPNLNNNSYPINS